MNKFYKYIASIVMGAGGCFIFIYIVSFFVGKRDGNSMDMAIIEWGIFLIAGLIIGCTALIIFTIEENKGK
jgi:hypothetical protein